MIEAHNEGLLASSFYGNSEDRFIDSAGSPGGAGIIMYECTNNVL